MVEYSSDGTVELSCDGRVSCVGRVEMSQVESSCNGRVRIVVLVESS